MNNKPYRSSSAAYRAIRHFEAKNGKTNFIVEKLGDKDYIVKKGGVPSFKDFKETLPLIQKVDNKTNYRYFPDGVKGEGYYELKTGNRRRPNSISLSLRGAYDGVVGEVFVIV